MKNQTFEVTTNLHKCHVYSWLVLNRKSPKLVTHLGSVNENQGTNIKRTNTANSKRWTQPCKTFVLPLVNVTTLTANVKRSNGRLAPCTPSVMGRFVTRLIINTAGIVSPIVASTEPSKMFTERCN